MRGGVGGSMRMQGKIHCSRTGLHTARKSRITRLVKTARVSVPTTARRPVRREQHAHTSSLGALSPLARVVLRFGFLARPAPPSAVSFSFSCIKEVFSFISVVALPPASRPRARIALILAVPPPAIT